jgi:hypothetical protein
LKQKFGGSKGLPAKVLHVEPQPPRCVPWTSIVEPFRWALSIVGGGTLGVTVGLGVRVRVGVEIEGGVVVGVGVRDGVNVSVGVDVFVGQNAKAWVSWMGTNGIPTGLS